MKTVGTSPGQFRDFCNRYSLDPSWTPNRGNFIRAVMAVKKWADSRPSRPSVEAVQMKVRERLRRR